MRELSTSFIRGMFLSLCCLPLLHAQAPTTAPTGSNAAVTPAPVNQAPDEATKKITDLVHAGKYADAQKLTEALLMAYPDDQRLIKAKALIEKMLAPSGSTSAAPAASPAAQPAAPANAEPLSGMDKVDYNALLVLARQAQQTADLDEQKKLLKQFMDQSRTFLEKHPDQLLLWQVRAQSAMSLNEPMEGYEAGQKLLAAEDAGSPDPALLQLLGEIKNKGWMDRQEAERQAAKRMEYQSLLGTWDQHYSRADHKGHEIFRSDETNEFKIVDSEIQAFEIPRNGKRIDHPWLKGTILDSGDINWVHQLGSAWHPIQVEIDQDHRVMKVQFPATFNINYNAFNTNGTPEQCTVTITLTKTGAPATGSFAPVSKQVQQSTATSSAQVPVPEPAGPAEQNTGSDSSIAVTAPASGTGVLHLYRPSHVAGEFSQYEIEIDGRQVGKIANAQSVRMDLPPGKYNINATYSHVKSDNPLYDLQIEAGKEYWVRVDLAVGFASAHMRLAVVPEAEAREESGKLKEITRGDSLSK
ncbi:MAG: DUF2846 domain-containing protein [Terracidiphilus sp.]